MIRHRKTVTGTPKSKEAGERITAYDPGQSAGAPASENEEGRTAGAVGLAVIIAPLVAYFNDRATPDDMDMLTFSLHHLFCRLDALNRDALPGLTEASGPIVNGQVPPGDLFCQRQIWLRLQQIKHTLDRIETLCHLLNRSAECILDDLDKTCKPFPGSRVVLAALFPQNTEQYWPGTIDPEQWEQAFTALAESLVSWQEHHRKITSFSIQFTNLQVTPTAPARLDAAFSTMLEGAGAIFGDILLSFRAIPEHDDEAAAALLFDLIQQADQLLTVYNTLQEPLNALIESFSAGNLV